MKNNIIFIFVFILISFFQTITLQAVEQFNFDVTEVEILENGNLYKGLKKGTVSTDEGIIIKANEFEYNKNLNKLNASGNVEITDTINNYKIYSSSVTYYKNNELIISKGNSKASMPEITIEGENFEYFKNDNTFVVKKNVKITDEINNVLILSQNINYNKNKELFFSSGYTESIIESKYNFKSSDVYFHRKQMKLYSEKKTKITDSNNDYQLAKFVYNIENKKLKGEKILVITDKNLPKSDKYFFENGFFDFDKKEFIAKNVKILLHPTLFGVEENNPRIKGVSSTSKNGITTVNKAIFTSCSNKNDKCPPWAISANKIIHDKNKKQLIYNDAVLKIYDYPVAYFPKFFHPDPTVKRQSGFLKPQINSSNVLGDSIYVPYFHVISENKDLTFKPTIFDSSMQMFQNEYRQQNKDSSLIADFSLTRGYKSSSSNTKNSISHLFAEFNSKLNFKNFSKSDLYVSLQKVSNDTYLKVFDSNLLENNLKPSDPNNLTSELKLTLDHENYNLVTGIQAFENLGLSNNDRFQYILPYYDFNKNFYLDVVEGQINFTSSGSNNLNNTNKLKTRIINDLEYKSDEIISNSGFVSKFNIYLKNLGTVGKKDNTYKSSPQIELMSLYEFASEFPLRKQTKIYNNTIIPKISLRFNPSDMKNYNTEDRNINVDNLFNINRLGLSDTFEAGKSLTIGFDYKKENLNDINKYFELKLGSVFRDKEENFVPTSSTLNKKNSNLFGSATNFINENLSIDYNFMIDNNLDRFEYNSITTSLIFDKFETKFNFVEENGDTGNENFLENTTSYNFDDNNYFSFKTRRNRKINLTEFYDLVYQYKNDCFVAGVKYNKTYYSDRDLKPKEDLLFSITLFPLTTYEHKQAGFN